MNVAIYSVTTDEMMELLNASGDDAIAIRRVGNLSAHIVCGMFNSRPIGFVGFIPRTAISETAYMWMQTTPFGLEHPLLIARYSKKVVDKFLGIYSTITGHCFTTKAVSWHQWLGADIEPPKDGAFPYTIRRA